MPEKDTSNLPILDDIVIPGDSEKAVPTPSSKVQSTSAAQDESTTSAVSLSNVATAKDVETSNQDMASATPNRFAESDDSDAETDAYAARTTAIIEELSQTVGRGLNAPTLNADIEPASVKAPNVDILTEEILSSLMPAVEQLLSEKIRQKLKQHLSAKAAID